MADTGKLTVDGPNYCEHGTMSIAANNVQAHLARSSYHELSCAIIRIWNNINTDQHTSDCEEKGPYVRVHRK